MEQVSIALLSFLQNFCVVLVAFELLLCRHLPKRSHFPLRLLAERFFCHPPKFDLIRVFLILPNM